MRYIYAPCMARLIFFTSVFSSAISFRSLSYGTLVVIVDDILIFCSSARATPGA